MSTIVTDTDTDIGVPALHFAAGIPGFPEARQFALVWWGDEDGPFSILTSLEQTGLEFLVVPPHAFFPDYAPEIDDDTVERLGLESADDAILMVIVTVGDQPGDATANLLAPVVVNRHTRAAAQVVLTEGDLPLRAPLFDA
jgi:flagellar assembly factor FliW